MHKVLKTIPKGNRTQVFVDNSSFLLYKGEMRKYHIEPDMELEDETYREILEVLYKRAKERALYLLDDSYKTEKQIRDTLKGGCYPESIINNVIIYLTEYGLVDDLRYAKLYIEYKSSSKSKKQIVQDLYVKGIQKKNYLSDITNFSTSTYLCMVQPYIAKPHHSAFCTLFKLHT